MVCVVTAYGDMNAPTASWMSKLADECIAKERDLQRLQLCQSNYEKLAMRLDTLPDKVAYDEMVSFGKLAAFSAKIRHTNEVLVLLGDNIFTLRSASQAAALARRRRDYVKTESDALQHQVNMLRSKHEEARTVFDEAGGDGVVEIREEYIEEEWETGPCEAGRVAMSAAVTTESPSAPATANARLPEIHCCSPCGTSSPEPISSAARNPCARKQTLTTQPRTSQPLPFSQHVVERPLQREPSDEIPNSAAAAPSTGRVSRFKASRMLKS